mmetsp:Transcript_57677/g.100986  ORF Transcript_57677/g.100986 Transcript_57677/m.100986 type:complete len:577 (-) Transcript_57677:86-1816(-)
MGEASAKQTREALRRARDVIPSPEKLCRYQQQVDRMFAGVVSDDCFTGSKLVSLIAAEPSPALKGRWVVAATHADRQQMLAELMPLMGSLSVIVFLCDFTDDDQFQNLLEIVYSMDADVDTPPMLAVELLPAGEVTCKYSNVVLERIDTALYSGLQDVITGGKCGLQLMHQITTSVIREQSIMNKLSLALTAKRNAKHQNSLMRYHLSMTLWHDMIQRLKLTIPLVDMNAQETQNSVNQREFGDHFMRGCWGWICQVKGAYASRECIKIIAKDKVLTLVGIKGIHNMLLCLEVLSTQEGRHPNILRLLNVTSTCEFLYLHLEYGRQCLHERLLESKKSKEAPERLQGKQLYSLCRQISAAVAHMHSRQICHRDLKPESFLVYSADVDHAMFSLLPQDSEGIWVKLTNFDLSVHVNETVRFSTPCGTEPFAAPEASVLANGQYDGLKADMWSTGITLLEVFCGIGIMDEILSRGPRAHIFAPVRESMELLAEVKRFFEHGAGVYESVDRILPEALSHKMLLMQILMGLMKIEPAQRMDAAWLLEHVNAPRTVAYTMRFRDWQVGHSSSADHAVSTPG